MSIDVAITLNERETFSLTPEETAQQIIDALDDVSPDKDYCSVSIRHRRQVVLAIFHLHCQHLSQVIQII